MSVPEEVSRVDHLRGQVERVVVKQDRAEDGPLRFEIVRERAFGDASHDITAGQMTLDTILAERGRELLFEARRRTDLIRFGLFTGGTYLWAWKGNQPGGVTTDAHYNLYAIPLNELSANPNLKQNPGF